MAARPDAKLTPEVELLVYRRDALKAARDFGYGDDVITEVKQAKTVGRISVIMSMARNNAK